MFYTLQLISVILILYIIPIIIILYRRLFIEKFMLCLSTRVKRIMINHNVSRHVSSATPQIFISFMKNLNSQKSARNNIIKTYKKNH